MPAIGTLRHQICRFNPCWCRKRHYFSKRRSRGVEHACHRHIATPNPQTQPMLVSKTTPLFKEEVAQCRACLRAAQCDTKPIDLTCVGVKSDTIFAIKQYNGNRSTTPRYHQLILAKGRWSDFELIVLILSMFTT